MDEATEVKSGGFKWQYIIWPFAIIGVLGLALVIFVALSLYSFDRPRPDPVVAVQENGEPIAFQLGGVRRVPGTPYWAVQVREERDNMGSFSKGYDGTIRNVLLLEESTGKSLRLLPSHNQKIETVSFWSKTGPVDDSDGNKEVSVTEAAAGAEPRTEKQASTAVYYIMFVHTLEDGKSRQALLIGEIVTQDHNVVVSGLSEIEDYWPLRPDTMALLARKDGALFYYIIDLANRKILLARKVAI